MYKYSTNTSYLILGEFVDDILCFGTDPGIIHWLTEQISSQFSITIKSSVDSFLGMQIYYNRSSHTISQSQPGYIVNLMSRFGIDTSLSTTFPTSPMSRTDIRSITSSTNPIATKNLYANSWFHIIFINKITPRPIVFCQ